jgi:hypothetical protein
MGREFFVRVYPPPGKSEITTDLLAVLLAAAPANEGRSEERRTGPLGRVLTEF